MPRTFRHTSTEVRTSQVPLSALGGTRSMPLANSRLVLGNPVSALLLTVILTMRKHRHAARTFVSISIAWLNLHVISNLLPTIGCGCSNEIAAPNLRTALLPFCPSVHLLIRYFLSSTLSLNVLTGKPNIILRGYRNEWL
jgi:hypothetical protein